MTRGCQTFGAQQLYCLSDAFEQVITRPKDSCLRPVSTVAGLNTVQRRGPPSQSSRKVWNHSKHACEPRSHIVPRGQEMTHIKFVEKLADGVPVAGEVLGSLIGSHV